MLAFFRNDMGFGGNNGFTDFKDILGLRPAAATARASRCSCSRALALAASYCACRFIVALARRPRDAGDPRRREPHAVPRLPRRVVQAVGLRRSRRCSPASPARCTCRRSASSTPASSQPINSIEVVIWVAVGGRGTLYGAAAGAVLVNYAKTYFTGALPGGLALRARRALRAGDAVPAARARRAAAAAGEAPNDAADARGRAPRRRRRREPLAGACARRRRAARRRCCSARSSTSST